MFKDNQFFKEKKFTPMKDAVDTAVFCYTKANPPNKTHGHLFKKVNAIAREHNGHAIIFLSKEYNSKQNPIPWKLRVEYIKKYVNGALYVVDDPEVISLLDALLFLYHRNYKKVIMLAGQHEINAIKNDIEPYNQKDGLFYFDSIDIIASGIYNPDFDTDTSLLTSAKARNAVLDNNFEEFKAIALYRNDEDAKRLFSMIKVGMGLTERFIKPITIKIKKR